MNKAGAGERRLDFGSGLGKGTEYLGDNVDDIEPFWKEGKRNAPTFESYDEILKSGKRYDGITNLNVLNVLPKEQRDEVATQILSLLDKDGVAVIGARSYADVMGTKGKKAAGDGGIYTSKGTYQYGFGGENETLKDYIESISSKLKGKFEITPAKVAATGVQVKRIK